MQPRDTDELMAEVQEAASLKSFLAGNEENFQSADVAELLGEMIRKKKLRKAALAKRAGMSEVYLHQILAGHRRPSRTRLICLGIGMGATLEECQELLRHSEEAILYAKSRRDAIIIYGISRGMDLFAINDMLFDAGENTLV